MKPLFPFVVCDPQDERKDKTRRARGKCMGLDLGSFQYHRRCPLCARVCVYSCVCRHQLININVCATDGSIACRIKSHTHAGSRASTRAACLLVSAHFVHPRMDPSSINHHPLGPLNNRRLKSFMMPRYCSHTEVPQHIHPSNGYFVSAMRHKRSHHNERHVLAGLAAR